MKATCILIMTLIMTFFLAMNAAAQLDSASSNQEKNDRAIRERLDELDQKGLDTAEMVLVFTNNFFFDVVFKKTSDPFLLKRSAAWMEKVVRYRHDDPVDIDTYANLLYKLGEKQKAIDEETRAWQLDLAKAQRAGRDPDPVFAETIKKMKSGQPTWL